MPSRRSESREEPFIGSLRERIQQTKAENARTRATSPLPSRVEGPPSEATMRAQRATRALEAAGDQRRGASRVWPVVVATVLLAAGAFYVVRSGAIVIPLGTP
ncbi:MAG TPA: hypothetical protein VE869_10050 [Gemmatimonas sp.]|nr:hypothetical protein [Gemmatimonas sp.]